MIDRRLLLALICWPAGCFSGEMPAAAQSLQPVVIEHEYEYKAAYLYHFAGLCKWPGDGEAKRIVIGVLAPNRFGRQLDRIEKQGEKLPRPIETRVFREIDEVQPCQILFVSSGGGRERAEERLRQVLEKTKGTATLILTEDPALGPGGAGVDAFARQGAAVNFYIENNRLKLLINRGAAEQAGVEIPSKLLNLKSVTAIPPRKADR